MMIVAVCVMLHGDFVMLCDAVLCCDVVWDVVLDAVSGGECCGKVKWLILSWWGVLVADEQTDIDGCRVAFATEKSSLWNDDSYHKLKQLNLH